MMTLHLIMLLPFLDFWAKQTMKFCRKTKSYYIQWLCWLGPRCCYHAAHSVLVYVQCDSVTISVVPAYKCTNTEYSIFSIIQCQTLLLYNVMYVDPRNNLQKGNFKNTCMYSHVKFIFAKLLFIVLYVSFICCLLSVI